MAFTVIFILRICSGLAQSPVFPGNGRICAAWFPASERGRSAAIFNSSQYFALPIFSPIFGGLIHTAGWQSCFLVPWRAGRSAHGRLVHEHLRRQGSSAHLPGGNRNHRARGRPCKYRREGKREEEHLDLGHGKDAAEPSHASGNLPGPVLHYNADVVLSYMVPALPFAGAAYVRCSRLVWRRRCPGLCGGFGGILGGIISDELLRRGATR